MSKKALSRLPLRKNSAENKLTKNENYETSFQSLQKNLNSKLLEIQNQYSDVLEV
jgi:hypothetical protein